MRDGPGSSRGKGGPCSSSRVDPSGPLSSDTDDRPRHGSSEGAK
jgi:hypothetical protein